MKIRLFKRRESSVPVSPKETSLPVRPKDSARLKQQVAELKAPALPTSTHKKAKAGPPPTPRKKIRGGVYQAKHNKKYVPLKPGRRRGGVIRSMPPALREIRNKQEAKVDDD